MALNSNRILPIVLSFLNELKKIIKISLIRLDLDYCQKIDYNVSNLHPEETTVKKENLAAIAVLLLMAIVVAFMLGKGSRATGDQISNSSVVRNDSTIGDNGFLGQWAEQEPWGTIEFLVVNPGGTGTYHDHPMKWVNTDTGIRVTMNEKVFADRNTFTFRMMQDGTIFSPEIGGGTALRRYEYKK
jgi:hypothetical protein